ncbi:MAG: FkbM family methyltransferase [Planctomycetaceae bacterium]|nr:FkbM family methyltransferase [Planctomycetaceae bacterium]MCB9952027.1 FkbM family methyltransferase [Planctomycetaceae bacterium]
MLRGKIRKWLLNLGWDVRRTSSWAVHKRAEVHRQELDKWRILKTLSPEAVLDIGANTGQFAELVRELLPQVRIISFEPLQDCFAKLQEKKQQLAPHDCYHCALGAENGKHIIHRNNFTPSSSLLEMQSRHKEELPRTEQTFPEEIQLRRLDDLAPELTLPENFFVKIDVQGYTAPVLHGGEQTLRKAAAIVAEVSLQPLYSGETRFAEAYEILTSWGFEYRGNLDQWISRKDARILQCDCLFERVT